MHIMVASQSGKIATTGLSEAVAHLLLLLGDQRFPARQEGTRQVAGRWQLRIEQDVLHGQGQQLEHPADARLVLGGPVDVGEVLVLLEEALLALDIAWRFSGSHKDRRLVWHEVERNMHEECTKYARKQEPSRTKCARNWRSPGTKLARKLHETPHEMVVTGSSTAASLFPADAPVATYFTYHLYAEC